MNVTDECFSELNNVFCRIIDETVHHYQKHNMISS